MTDIVKRLRGRPAPGDHCSKLIAEAADEIERLRSTLRQIEALENGMVPADFRLAIARSLARATLTNGYNADG